MVDFWVIAPILNEILGSRFPPSQINLGLAGILWLLKYSSRRFHCKEPFASWRRAGKLWEQQKGSEVGELARELLRARKLYE